MPDYEANTELTELSRNLPSQAQNAAGRVQVGPCVMAKGTAHRYEYHTQQITAVKGRHRLDSSAVRVPFHAVTDT